MKINLLPHIYFRFHRFETPTESSEIEDEKLLAKIIEKDIYYDITNVEAYVGSEQRQREMILEKVDDHMVKRYDICRDLGIKGSPYGRITQAVPASIILEKVKMNASKKKLTFVYSVTENQYDIDYDVLEQICAKIYDEFGILKFIDEIKSAPPPPSKAHCEVGDSDEERAFGGGSKFKGRRRSKKRKSKRRKSKRRKSKRRKTRRKKR